MANKREVLVIAGTLIDADMGVRYLQAQNKSELIISGKPAAGSCDEQVKFQYSPDAKKRARMNEIFDAAIADGVRDFFIYCNSLSGAFDFDSYEIEKNAELEAKNADLGAKNTELKTKLTAGDETKEGNTGDGSQIHIYTPLQIYRNLGSKYSCLGVMAANNLSAHAIEEALISANPDIYVIGTGNMSIVRAIEEGRPPQDIVRDCGIASMLDYMEASGAEALVIGCTHFPYIREELSNLTSLPLLDPADLMFQKLLQNRYCQSVVR